MKYIDPTGLTTRAATEEEMAVFRNAAVYAYGEANATILLNHINGVYFDDEIKNDGEYNTVTNTITLAAIPTPNGPQPAGDLLGKPLAILGTFIHELYHAWEDYMRVTNKARQGVPGRLGPIKVSPGSGDSTFLSKYSFLQLITGALSSEQKARVIQDWFQVTYANHLGILRRLGSRFHMAERDRF